MANQGSTVCVPCILKCSFRVLLLAFHLSPGMLTLKSEAIEDLVSPNSSDSATRELNNWERLVFAFEMDRETPSNPRKPQRSRSSSSTTNATGQRTQTHDGGGVNAQDAALLAQFAAGAGGSDHLDHSYSNMLPQQNPYPSMAPTSGFYGNFLHHSSMPPPQLPPLSSLDFPWHSLPPPSQAGPSHYDPHSHHASSSTSMGTLPFLQTQYNTSAPPDMSRDPSRRSNRAQTQAQANQPHASSSPEVEQTEAEQSAMSDEKRRRNTAASARFRIKKKHKTLSLERSVSELTGRAEELEREATDLRRENGWLKEIVMLKGTQFAANNLAHRQALVQAAALAMGSSASGSTSATTADPIPEESGSGSSNSESSDEEEKASKKKGKGKKPSKSTK